MKPHLYFQFTLYLEKLIVEADQIDERTCVIQRALEIMMVLLEYNNFNGVIAITSAMNSSSVHRLVLRIKDVSTAQWDTIEGYRLIVSFLDENILLSLLRSSWKQF